MFTSTILELLQILAVGTQARYGVRGLTLEISAHSPSDIEHVFRDFRMKDSYPFRSEDDLDGWHEDHLESLHMKTAVHTWMTAYNDAPRDHLNLGFQLEGRLRPIPGAIERFLGTPLDFDRCHPLPKVPIVRGLLFRSQFYRQLSPTALGRLFRQSLVSAEWLTLERWCRNSAGDEAEYIQGTCDMAGGLQLQAECGCQL